MRQQAIMQKPGYTGDYQMTKMNSHGMLEMPPVTVRYPTMSSDTTSGVSGQLPNNWQDRHDVRARRGEIV